MYLLYNSRVPAIHIGNEYIQQKLLIPKKFVRSEDVLTDHTKLGVGSYCLVVVQMEALI